VDGQGAKYAREFEHCVIDTEARPEEEDLKAVADGCELLIIPTTPDALALDALMLTVKASGAVAGRDTMASEQQGSI
jgi:chromosome partitioning protein